MPDPRGTVRAFKSNPTLWNVVMAAQAPLNDVARCKGTWPTASLISSFSLYIEYGPDHREDTAGFENTGRS